jgi:hypothetical protein
MVGTDKDLVKIEKISLTQSDILTLWLHLHEKGVKAFSRFWPTLYCYDKDTIYDTALGEVYKFFVVHDGQIVSECEYFYDRTSRARVSHLIDVKSDDDSLDLSMLDRSIGGWTGPTIHYWDSVDAMIRFWYRKFYEETEDGRKMALRRDRPRLFFYPDGREPSLNDEVRGIKKLVMWIGFGVCVLILLAFSRGFHF